MNENFSTLKIALQIIMSNYTNIHYAVKYKKSSTITIESNTFNTRVSFIPNSISITILNNNYTISSDKIVKGSWYNKKLDVNISDIDGEDDLFALSTIRDFYDLTYEDIKTVKYLCSELN